MLLAWPVGGRSKPPQLSLLQRLAWPATTGDTCTKITCSPNHLRGHHRQRHYDGTPPDIALTPLGAHLACSCHCQRFWAHLITTPSHEPETKSTLCSTSFGGLSRTRCFLQGLQVAGANLCSYLWLQRWEWPTTTKGL